MNQRLADAPELINQQPYGDEWLIMIKPLNLEDESKSLLSAKEYEEFVEGLADEKKQDHISSTNF